MLIKAKKEENYTAFFWRREIVKIEYNIKSNFMEKMGAGLAQSV
jgi:hypothetical protein